MNALVYVDIDQGIHKGKLKVARNENRKKLFFLKSESIIFHMAILYYIWLENSYFF